MKGVAVFFGLFLFLMALLLWAKSQPASAAPNQTFAKPTPIIASKILPPEAPTATPERAAAA